MSPQSIGSTELEAARQPAQPLLLTILDYYGSRAKLMRLLCAVRPQECLERRSQATTPVLETAMRLRVAVLSVLLLATQVAGATAADLLVFAAVSLKNALEEAGKAYSTRTAATVRFSFAASSALARQVEQGAPADVFASADVEWMDHLASRKLIEPRSRADLFGNRLVVITARDSRVSELPLTSTAFQDALGSGGRIATGEITAVPTGRYAKAALEKLGLWAELQPRLAQAENVRAALLLVSRGEAPLGIVYATDAAVDPQVKVVAAMPESSHPPIVYPFAVVSTGKREPASAFLRFLQGPEAQRIFEAQGFAVRSQPPLN